MSSTNRKAVRDWVVLCLYSLVIFLTLPAARSVQKGLKERGLEGLITGGPVLLVLFVLLAVLWTLWVKKRERRASAYFYLANLGITYYLVFQSLADIPVERVHLLEYGFASYLALRVARHYREGWRAYLLTLVLVFDIGFLDEVIQYFLPQRVYDPRDVVTNTISGILGLLVYLVLTGSASAVSGKSEASADES